MAMVHIPAAMRALTSGRTDVEAAGANIGAVIDALDAQFPGLKLRFVENGHLRPGLALFVDGVQSTEGLATKLQETSEVYFSPAVSGG